MISHPLTHMCSQAQNVRIMWSVCSVPPSPLVPYASHVQGSVLAGMSFVLLVPHGPMFQRWPHTRPEAQAEEYEKRELSLDITFRILFRNWWRRQRGHGAN